MMNSYIRKVVEKFFKDGRIEIDNVNINKIIDDVKKGTYALHIIYEYDYTKIGDKYNFINYKILDHSLLKFNKSLKLYSYGNKSIKYFNYHESEILIFDLRYIRELKINEIINKVWN